MDLDGCIYNHEYQRLYDNNNENPIINANKTILDKISKSGSRKILMLGSNRQDGKKDIRNSRKNGTHRSHQAMDRIANYINAEYDNVLLNDTGNGCGPFNSQNRY